MVKQGAERGKGKKSNNQKFLLYVNNGTMKESRRDKIKIILWQILDFIIVWSIWVLVYYCSKFVAAHGGAL